MTRIIKFAGLGSAALLALSIGGAQAQIRGDAPVEVAANEFEGFNAQGLAVYRGNVEAVQDQSRLRCSELRIQFARRGGAAGDRIGGGFGEPTRYTCMGPVWYITPREVARGNNAVFEVATDIITMTGDVVLRQGQNVATGDRLTVNTRTNDSRLEAANPGTGPNRVRSVLYPESTPARPQQQTPPAGAR
jgi:lipopolysaccharide export system protein LptA